LSENITITEARACSKRFSDKNIKVLEDLPLIVLSINYANANCAIINEIYVTTDSDIIKQIVLDYGAKVIHRPK
jgi:N-acylneuraminate cytidylyltransferase